MKKRRVIIVLEVETAETLHWLKKKMFWQGTVDDSSRWDRDGTTVLQARANVVRGKK